MVLNKEWDNLSMERFVVYRKWFWIFTKFFCECEELFFLNEDQVILCKNNKQVIAILDKKLFRYAKRK